MWRTDRDWCVLFKLLTFWKRRKHLTVVLFFVAGLHYRNPYPRPVSVITITLRQICVFNMWMKLMTFLTVFKIHSELYFILLQSYLPPMGLATQKGRKLRAQERLRKQAKPLYLQSHDETWHTYSTDTYINTHAQCRYTTVYKQGTTQRLSVTCNYSGYIV